jgi:hypothetical protein
MWQAPANEAGEQSTAKESTERCAHDGQVRPLFANEVDAELHSVAGHRGGVDSVEIEEAQRINVSGNQGEAEDPSDSNSNTLWRTRFGLSV